MRLWEDGFDHYGTDEGNMLDGSYASATSDGSTGLTSARAATGTHSFYTGSGGGFRKVLPSSKTAVGAMGRFYFAALPNDAPNSHQIFIFHGSPANISHIACSVGTNGELIFIRGENHTAPSAGTVIATTDPLIVASAWNHVEVQVGLSNTLGWIRVAVNGVHRYAATGLDTLATTEGGGSAIHSIGSGWDYYYSTQWTDGVPFYIDDIIYYDLTGDPAVDTDFCPTLDAITGIPTSYIGELQVWLLMATADTAEADWAKSTGSSGFALIDETNPNDADYIYSTADTDLSEFDFADLPEEITYIRGVSVHSRLSKSDAGAAFYRVGFKSVAATSDAAERPMTVEPTYWHDQVNVDPNSSARWTRASLNAAKLRVRRTV